MNQRLAGRQTATVFQEAVLPWEVTACLHNAHYTELMSCEEQLVDSEAAVVTVFR